MPQPTELDISLQPKQSELLDLCENSKASFLGFGGSRGGAKSGGARRIMLLRRIKYPGTTGLIFRRVYDDLKRNHIDKFFEDFPSLFKYYRATDHEVVLPIEKGKAPSRIVFAYAETEAEVKRKFHGPEYMDMFIDQAEQVSEFEMKLMKTANRWPGVHQHQCKFVVFFNPGGISLPYFKRVFKDKKFKEKERPDDFRFIQAYGWDNVEWARSALIEDGLTVDDYYSMSNDERFKFFIQRTQYGRELDSLPEAMRIGHLMGSLDVFAGQYFDIWDPSVMVKPCFIEPWHPRWISIDWGFAHNSDIQWHAQDDQITRTYREFTKSGLGPKELAMKIASMSRMQLDGQNEQEGIDAIYLSPDAFAKRTTEDSVAKQLGDYLVPLGFPRPRAADNDRIGGWLLMHEKLKYGTWIIDPSCKALIDNIPLFTRQGSEDDPEDCIKFDGDDPGDNARYGLKSRLSAREAPKEVQYGSRMKELVAKVGDQDMSKLNTMKHLESLRFKQAWGKAHRPVRPNRNWRRGF